MLASHLEITIYGLSFSNIYLADYLHRKNPTDDHERNCVIIILLKVLRILPWNVGDKHLHKSEKEISIISEPTVEK